MSGPLDTLEGQTMTLDPAEGGRARWKGTTAEERSEAARKASEARWNAKLPQATHEGVLTIGATEIQCYVLEGGERVISTRGVMKALGRRWRGRKYTGTDLPVFLEARNLKPFITKELDSVLSVREFRTPRGPKAEAFNAKLLPLVCETYLSARDAGALTPAQVGVAAKADILMRALAHTGIIALVDEATGYQYDRPRRDLEEHLKKFLSESLVRWARTFPNDYFRELCRLKGVVLRPDMRLPQYFGHLTGNLVYRRIAPGLLEAVKERRAERGRPSNKLYWWTSQEIGHPSLLLHLGTVVGLMKINTDYDAFVKQLDQVAPIYPESPGLFDDPADWEKPAIGG
jgi:hypothetical protein